MHCAWWNAWRETLYEYLPHLISDTFHSVANYCRAWWEATDSTCKRVYSAMLAVWWFWMLILSASVYGPMALYDVLEYLCCGGLGVVAMLAVLNMLNYLFHWTPYGVYTSSVIIVVGVLTHAWRQGRPEGYLEEVAPGTVLELALKSVRKDAKTRQRREAESLRRLQNNDEELPELITDDTVVTRRKVRRRKRAPTAMAAELREAEQLVVRLRHEIRTKTTDDPTFEMEDQHPHSRRGRSSLSQGDCPEPWQDVGMPEGRVLGPAIEDSPRKVATSKQVGSNGVAYRV
ncbi:hypothetical protein PHMEG_00028660 [Phytophthora megakarya]|uniref:Transmembrane protein n=1 Tax=Phytophthora megakarya TaxID=4795 RepID=A0A225V4H5_9STRA|nr:hypothetical protein PHMEG_00028660 [Phytophthora megakarya]